MSSRRSADITPDYVLDLDRPTRDFLCPLSANVYNIEFLSFTIEDYDTKHLIFEVSRDRPPKFDHGADLSTLGEDAMRKIKYPPPLRRRHAKEQVKSPYFFSFFLQDTTFRRT
mmetsp:Transcript_29495/g.66103  ORF Transcript_29495/g.66103 Transcript_29495/m.66103 type:complete len:113 (-) Transcript_29495:910-1248(-)